MDAKLLTVFIGIVSGAIGYWLNTFAMQPILRYREIKNQILIDFIYFAQVVNAEGLNDEMKALHRERVKSNRKASAKLSAAFHELPCWYKFMLKRGGLAPEEAASHLIGFSNTTDYDEAHKKQAAIRKKLGLPKET